MRLTFKDYHLVGVFGGEEHCMGYVTILQVHHDDGTVGKLVPLAMVRQ